MTYVKYVKKICKKFNIQSWHTAGSKEQKMKINVYSIIARKARSGEEKNTV